MFAAADATPAWFFASCFGLSIVSALVPWVNGEAVAVSFAVAGRSPLDLALIALLTAAGQMAGKCVLFSLGSSAGRLRIAGDGRVRRWRERLRGRGTRALAIVFVSSAIGVPPLYLTTLAAGTVGMRFSRFFGAAACGRLLRFGAVVCVPSLVRAWR
jgi:membrane protein YqaA with SNARE-associated domain